MGYINTIMLSKTLDFIQLVQDIAQAKTSHYYYTAELITKVTRAQFRDTSTLTVEFIITADELNGGCLDEGLMATVADYWTSVLISAVQTKLNHHKTTSVTTSLTVHASGQPIELGTPVHLVCSFTPIGNSVMSYAVAQFVCGEGTILAEVLHSKYTR